MMAKTSEIPLAPNIMETCGFIPSLKMIIMVTQFFTLAMYFLPLGTLAHLNVQLPVS